MPVKDLAIILCPKCKNANLVYSQRGYDCPGCRTHFAFNSEGQLPFIHFSMGPAQDSLDAVKALFKKYSGFYSFLRRFFAPVLFGKDLANFVEENVKPGRQVVHLGSGNSRLHQDILNIDIISYGNVNIVADITSIPLASESADAIILDSVLEHVQFPDLVLKEVKRVLKPQGNLFVSVPFTMGFHACPDDYYRWSKEGSRILLRDFKIVKEKQEGGPTSALLWVFQEWLSLILSFGIKKLHIFWYIFLMVTTWPLKYLDLLLAHIDSSHKVASAFIFICKKND